MTKWIAMIAALASGCAHNLAANTPATGEPLAVEWNTLRQGSAPIDEEDFYRIARDDDAAADIDAYRSHGVVMNRVGLVLALVGGAALVTYALDDDASVRDRAAPMILALPIGGILSIMGSQRLERDRVLPSWRAQDAANRYDAGLGVASP